MHIKNSKVKRRLSIAFLLFAGTIILAHAVVPHHDHDDMTICFGNSPCNDDACSDRCCTIDNIFDTTDNKVKTVCHIHSYNCECCWQTLYILTSNTLDIQDCIDDASLLFLHAPYIDNCHADFVSQSLGLRAPPVLN